jgi:branched-chain amino acid aminotransferase
MTDISKWSDQGKLVEAFGVGTAVIVAPIGRIGFRGKDIILPLHDGGLGPVGRSLWKQIVDIQEGKVDFNEWGYICE